MHAFDHRDELHEYEPQWTLALDHDSNTDVADNWSNGSIAGKSHEQRLLGFDVRNGTSRQI